MKTTAGIRDRSGWQHGPWDGEPDRIEWRSNGFPCLMVRNALGTWCGYVGLHEGHPYYGADYNHVPVDVHGGLTYGEQCAGHICHVPEPGEPDHVYWLGFDCAHGFDVSPALSAHFGCDAPDAEYRDVPYVQAEVEKLAEQLATLAGSVTP